MAGRSECRFVFAAAIGIGNVSGKCTQMPFAKMPGAVAFFFDHLGQGDLLDLYMTAIGAANAHTGWMSPVMTLARVGEQTEPAE